MKLLLTSAGVKNASIRTTLVDLLGKRIEECTALCVPTAAYAMSGGPGAAWRQISGRASTPMSDLGWKSLGVLELTALPSLDADLWVPLVQETDALLVGGGDALYLAHWMRESGLADLFPSLRDTVYLGVSGGSMAMAPQVGEEFVGWKPPAGGDAGLGVVDFAMFPHLDHPDLPENSMADAEQWAAALSVPGYALDDQTALTVVDGAVDVISEGNWRLFTP
ncbi:Type 1 glutamine amidotransferase-like domain-containing protein [Actinacidiphila acidipaludis]|uniref:Type 1 glutamine amidotransferase-like domain-containing protein n=1 Tax=Actinacidiphila acidipaludis TaxID=2873382 RepID=A0ABS7QDG1_9ACTN|nr:Type 1 glutamine amidotransferase-like domain-containing protein [Streptomyces acidipaludis]MBY8880861.1 Type 1 glutamine amidotransferase-like domain-containing protein [Streptomyces acidipaludis]